MEEEVEVGRGRKEEVVRVWVGACVCGGGRCALGKQYRIGDRVVTHEFGGACPPPTPPPPLSPRRRSTSRVGGCGRSLLATSWGSSPPRLGPASGGIRGPEQPARIWQCGRCGFSARWAFQGGPPAPFGPPPRPRQTAAAGELRKERPGMLPWKSPRFSFPFLAFRGGRGVAFCWPVLGWARVRTPPRPCSKPWGLGPAPPPGPRARPRALRTHAGHASVSRPCRRVGLWLARPVG